MQKMLRGTSRISVYMQTGLLSANFISERQSCCFFKFVYGMMRHRRSVPRRSANHRDFHEKSHATFASLEFQVYNMSRSWEREIIGNHR